MALEKLLSTDDAYNDYGINFENAYFKIDNVRLDLARNKVSIEIRGYASTEARELQKQKEALKIELQEKKRLLMKGELEEEITIEELDEQLSEAQKTVIGIFKEVFTVPFSGLDMTPLKTGESLIDGVKDIVYNYLKTLDYFIDSKDV